MKKVIVILIIAVVSLTVSNILLHQRINEIADFALDLSRDEIMTMIEHVNLETKVTDLENKVHRAELKALIAAGEAPIQLVPISHTPILD